MTCQFELAVEEYKKAIKADAQYADPYFNLGVMYEKMGNTEAAAESYRNFLERLGDKTSLFYKKVSNRLKEIQAEE